MPARIQTNIYFVAGDTVSFDVPIGDYPTTDWTCNWVIAASPIFQQAGTIVGPNHHIEVAPATSATIPPGKYGQTFVFTKTATGERRSVGGNDLFVLPNPTVVITTTWAQDTLVLVEAALKKLAARTNAEVIVNGQTYRKENMAMLADFRDRLRNEVMTTEAAAGRPARGGAKTLVTRFRG